MGRMIDTWHDLYHQGTTIDLIHCPHCQDEFVQATGHTLDELVSMTDFIPDRLEDLEI
jgi:hypothetical protein